MAEKDRDDAIHFALADLGTAGNMQSLIALLRGGVTDPGLIAAAVVLLEEFQASRASALRRAEEKLDRERKISDAFEYRLEEMF